MTRHQATTTHTAPVASGKIPYSKPKLISLDADETATGPFVFTQEVLVYYTPPS